MFLEYLRIVLGRTLERAISRVSIEVLIDAFELVLSTLKICSRFIRKQFQFVFSRFLLLYCFVGFLDLFINVH